MHRAMFLSVRRPVRLESTLVLGHRGYERVEAC
jgi:hypothetical protein